MVRVEERARYVSEMGMVWTRFPGLVALGLLAGLAVGWGLNQMFAQGWYWIIIVPMFAGLILAGILHLLVGWAQCRNRWLAGLLGAVVALTAYLSYFEFGLYEQAPPGAGLCLELLPDYIVFRMETDVVKDKRRPDNQQKEKKASPGHNWSLFAIELAGMVVFASVGAAKRAGYAYSLELRQWMRREKTLLLEEHLPGLRQALDTDRLEEFVAQVTPASDVRVGFPFTLEYAVPAEGLVLRYPVYASLDVPQGKWAPLRAGGLRRLMFWQIQLTPREVLALRPLFPQLAQLLAVQHEELRGLPVNVQPAPASTPSASGSVATSTTATASPSTTPSVAEMPAELARVAPVPEPYRQRVRSKGYALAVNLRGAMSLGYLVLGAALLGGGIWAATKLGWTFAWAGVPLGAMALGWGYYVASYCSNAPESLWILRRLRQELAQRPDPIVAPNDPEAIYLSLIPRESFTRIQWTMSSDLLFLKIDTSRRQLFLEGDCDRYWIPLGAVSVCEPQCFFHPIDKQHQNELWMVRLVIRVEEGLRELLLAVGPTSYAPLTNVVRRQKAEALCSRINALRG